MFDTLPQHHLVEYLTTAEADEPVISLVKHLLQEYNSGYDIRIVQFRKLSILQRRYILPPCVLIESRTGDGSCLSSRRTECQHALNCLPIPWVFFLRRRGRRCALPSFWCLDVRRLLSRLTVGRYSRGGRRGSKPPWMQTPEVVYRAPLAL